LEHLNMSENRIKEKIKEFNDAIASIQI
jgi:hypothetical protein